MCCILYIPAGVETPTIQTFEAVFMYNRHGIGFADSDGHCCKTLSFRYFTKAIQKRKKSADCIIHFRLATHGSVSRANCHPFFDRESGVWFAHNGILPIESHNTTISPIPWGYGYDVRQQWCHEATGKPS